MIALALAVIVSTGAVKTPAKFHGYMMIDDNPFYCIATTGCVDVRCSEEDVCRDKYTAGIRPSTDVTNKLKAEQMAQVGNDGEPASFEEDHFIPLELCGAPGFHKEGKTWVRDEGVANLWPQPWPEARKKDAEETRLHRAVCKGLMTLQEAQAEIREHWRIH